MWKDNVRTVEPYVPGEQPKVNNLIKLNTNENPYPPAPAVSKALKEMDYDAFRKYPDPTCSVLVNALAKEYGLKTSQVFVGVGSDDVLAMLFLTFFNGKKPVLFPDITYSFYDVWANLYRIPYKQIPLTEDFKINTDDYLQENGGIVIANPNAPTGELLGVGEIEKIVKANPDSVVIVDEAYHYFYSRSFLKQALSAPNVVVLRTFSKLMSLAAVRLGVVIGNPELVGCVRNLRLTFDANAIALLFAERLMEHPEIVDSLIKTQQEGKDWLLGQLRAQKYWCRDCMGNFIFIKTANLFAVFVIIFFCGKTTNTFGFTTTRCST